MHWWEIFQWKNWPDHILRKWVKLSLAADHPDPDRKTDLEVGVTIHYLILVKDGDNKNLQDRKWINWPEVEVSRRRQNEGIRIFPWKHQLWNCTKLSRSKLWKFEKKHIEKNKMLGQNQKKEATLGKTLKFIYFYIIISQHRCMYWLCLFLNFIEFILKKIVFENKTCQRPLSMQRWCRMLKCNFFFKRQNFPKASIIFKNYFGKFYLFHLFESALTR